MPEDMIEIQKETYDDGCCVPKEEPHYPYGTCLTIRDELLAQLNAEGMKVGDVVEVKGMAVVKATSERKDEDTNGEDSEKRIEVQMTHLSLGKKGKDRVDQMYGDE